MGIPGPIDTHLPSFSEGVVPGVFLSYTAIGTVLAFLAAEYLMTSLLVLTKDSSSLPVPINVFIARLPTG